MDQRVKMTPMEKLESLGNVLDKLGDLPGGGRSKCGLIWVANDILNGLHHDILIMEEKMKAGQETAASQEQVPEIEMVEVVSDEEDGNGEEAEG